MLNQASEFMTVLRELLFGVKVHLKKIQFKDVRRLY